MKKPEGIHPVQKIAVLGVGQMGAWFAEKLKALFQVAVFDWDIEKSQRIGEVVRLGKFADLEAFAPDLLLNAVNIQNTIPVFEKAMKYLPPPCILADITSVKANLPENYAHWGRRFVSTHPMFGPTFADIRSLKEENAIIIRESDPEGKQFFHEFYRRFQLNIFEYSFDEHDQIIAYSLTVPFASTMVFAAHLDSSAVPGTTFKRHLQIAQGLLGEDDYLLAEILFNPYSLPQLEKITQRLEFLKHIIRERDYEEARRFFQRLRENIQK